MCLHHLFQTLTAFRILFIPGIKLLPLRIFRLLILKSPDQKFQTVFPGQFRLFQGPFLLPRHSQTRKQLLNIPDQIRRSERSPVRRHRSIRQVQQFLWFSQHRVQIKFLNIGLFFPSGGKFRPSGPDFLPVILGEQPARAKLPWKEAVVCAKEKQGFDISKPRPLHVSGHDFINSRRNDTDFRFLESGVQKLPVFLQRNRLLPEKRYKFIKQIDDNPVNLRVFLCKGGLAALLKKPFLFPDLPVHAFLHEKIIKRFRNVPYRLFLLPQHEDKAVHLFDKPDTKMIDFCKLFFAHPFAFPDPGALPLFVSPDSKGKHIVFQCVNFLHRKSAKARPQKPEYAFVGKSLLDHGRHTADVFYKWI